MYTLEKPKPIDEPINYNIIGNKYICSDCKRITDNGSAAVLPPASNISSTPSQGEKNEEVEKKVEK